MLDVLFFDSEKDTHVPHSRPRQVYGVEPQRGVINPELPIGVGRRPVASVPG